MKWISGDKKRQEEDKWRHLLKQIVHDTGKNNGNTD